jgi:nicotinamidase-related amidase
MRAAPYASANTLDDQAARWLAEIRATVAPRPHLVLQVERCALLVVDMLRYFADPAGRSFLPAAAPTVSRIAALVDAWRAQGSTVVFTRHCHQGDGDLGMLGKFFSDYIRCGERDSEIIEPLCPEPGETVIQKRTYDAFWDTELDPILRDRGCSQVLITGVLTHMCCDTTARSAFCRGYEVYLPVDGVASSQEELHIGALRGLASSVAILTHTDEVLQRCRTSA